ncbi:protein SPT2 homolog [Ceratitis capitata]|uniref:Protein SPT2 homolog n=1 Tax=Ceratitis capitata TaxID=7213 RepID=W8BY13_CERCA|nr:protein SPT2 homolog [Ceratitis capitata]
MDFGTLLHVAKKNSDNTKNESKYYSTKFAPPKKESKDKKLSANIQKFLQKREQEEREREREKQQKLASLLAMRDEKSKNKIRKMLKVTKSANKSVLDDAINTDHTAVTMTGPDQPDQDDYGYVSTEANAFYAKYIEKVKDVKEDKGFAPSRPQSLKDLSGTKERVKAAITRETEEKLKGHKTPRTSSSSTSLSSGIKEPSIVRSSSSKPIYDPEAERREEERKKREEEQNRKKNRKPAPPPMDFKALLKLAEQKQHEPVEILPVVKKKEPERLLTMKEKKEMEERQRAKEARERRDRERAAAAGKERKENGVNISASSGPARMEPNGRIPKLNQATKPTSTTTTVQSSSKSIGASSKPSGGVGGTNGFKKPFSSSAATTLSQKESTNSSAKSSSSSLTAASSSSSVSAKQSHSSANKPSSVSSKSAATSASASASSSSSKNPFRSSSSKNPYTNGTTREFPPRDLKSIKPRQFPPPDVQKTRQFPPPDMQRNRGKETKKPQANKRLRIEDDDSEYDSEMDDFIDDGDEEEDYSSHIRAIFGYDKQKYRDLDDGDDTAMESNFAQVQREEYISKKIGIQEDLEDMKLEALEKRRKMMAKKRKLQ